MEFSPRRPADKRISLRKGGRARPLLARKFLPVRNRLQLGLYLMPLEAYPAAKARYDRGAEHERVNCEF
jgi:hypothetical protein